MTDVLDATEGNISLYLEQFDEEDSFLEEDFDLENVEEDSEIKLPSIEKIDRSLYEFVRLYQKGTLILNPEWQRNFVWKPKQQSLLIESFLIDLPVPVVYLAQNDQEKYEVVDGLQRLTTVIEFIAGSGKVLPSGLTDLKYLKKYKGYKFVDLPENLQNKLENAYLRTFQIPNTMPKDMLFQVFERLNTGGTSLNSMEIRNCIYRGKLNSLIKELSQYAPFVECVNQKNISQRMKDRNLVLRFLAFYECHYTKCIQSKGLDSFLNDFCENFRNPTDKKIQEFKDKFINSMNICKTIFGNNSFRTRKSSNGRNCGEWSSSVNAILFQIISVSFANYNYSDIIKRSDIIYEDFLDLLQDDKFILAVAGGRHTSKHENIEYGFKCWNDRLRIIMDNIDDKEPRCFSKEIKVELFQQNPTCKICQQEIKLINDAHIDHDEYYWRGGKTIPENARLVHRKCNLDRSKK